MAVEKTLLNLRRASLLMCALALVGWGTVFADIAPNPLSGGKNLANKGVKETRVVMVDEIVKLRVSREACYVDVVFTMMNKGDAAETMQVGFPFFHPDELKDFKAAVDDKSIDVTSEKGGPLKGETFDAQGWIPNWKLWNMTFPPDKAVKITVSYWTKLASAPWSWNHDLQSVPGLLTSLLQFNERAAMEKQLAVRRVSYILRTGSDWAGPIGRCRIEVLFDGMTTGNLMLNGCNFEIEHATVTSDKIVWDLKDYEPKRDVEFTITPFINRKALLQVLERVQKQYAQRAVLTAELVEHLNAAGRQSEAEETLLQFLNQCKDRVVIWGQGGKQDLSLDESVKVFNLIRQIVDPRKSTKDESLADRMDPRGMLPTFQPGHLEAFVPAIERISQRVKDQLKQVPPDKANLTKDYAKDVDTFLAWCQKHAH